MEMLHATRQAWTAVINLLEELDDTRWRSSTGCAGWSVHDVAAHLGHLEGMVNGFPQPPIPGDFDPGGLSGLDEVTEEGVAARRGWSHEEVLDEIRGASAATLRLLEGLDEAGWQAPAPSPVGIIPRRQAQDLRLADLWVHLLDMRYGLGMALDIATEPDAAEMVIARAVRLIGWGAVKRAGLPNGTRIRLQIAGPGGVDGTLVVEDGRGMLVAADDAVPDRIAGPGLAFLLAAGGRSPAADTAGGLSISGRAAARFVDGYRIFE